MSHQQNYRDKRNRYRLRMRYLHQVGRLNHLAGVMQIELPVLVRYLARLQALHQQKEASEALTHNTAQGEARAL